MKKIKTIVVNLRNVIRNMGFLSRTAISAALAFVAVLAVAIVADAAYNFMASHSGLMMIAGIVGGQVFLYAGPAQERSQTADGRSHRCCQWTDSGA